MEEQKRAALDQLKSLVDSGIVNQSKYEELSVQLGQSNRTSKQWNGIDQIVVCFFADGSDKYTQMTIMALSSFLEKTPRIKAGLLTHNKETCDRIFSKLDPIYHSRIVWHQTSETPHLINWNPTQYKLDIAKFMDDGFENIFWMDSDTITFGDMTQFLVRFAESNKQFFLVKDHVMFNSDFVANWTRERPLGIVPQACFMGFKYSIIKPFFALWREIWGKWIHPHPFASFPDPNPNFIGSMFCIEQYALAMALAQFLGEHNLGDDAIMLFERELILLQSDGRMSFDIVSKIPKFLSGTSGLSGLNFSGVNLSSLGYNISSLKIGASGINLSGTSVSGLGQLLSGLNLSGLNFSGISISGLLAALNVSGINISGGISGGLSGLNVSGLSSGLNISGVSGLSSGLNISGVSGINILLSLLSAFGVSGLSYFGASSGVYLSGLTTEQLLSRLSVSGINLSGINLSGLTLGAMEKMLAGASIDLSGIDFKYLQGGADDVSGSNLALVDKFGNSFVHYYHQNFEPLKEGSMKGGSFTEYFSQQK